MKPVEILFLIPDDWDEDAFAGVVIFEAEKLGKVWGEEVLAEQRPNLTKSPPRD